ncbi:hypothetical protein [Rubellicoccus peritrichatus]|uniref:Uncharacterized protein n=1 Tax=Rubellicoccus peritrichatus TaxID=3080537 RepID=A0AAQ3LBD9_9BACT|nr:hypothetical protein [Puniceicoccus sp. CR14]WOO40363.1 hypothetical protein RZN69_17225 [Puniceicoccus sp. CR14]
MNPAALLLIAISILSLIGLFLLVRKNSAPTPAKLLGFAVLFSFLMLCFRIIAEDGGSQASMGFMPQNVASFLFLGLTFQFLIRIPFLKNIESFFRDLSVATFSGALGFSLLMPTWAIPIALSTLGISSIIALVILRKSEKDNIEH